MALIGFDARDAFVPMPHGSGIYVRRLLAALPDALGTEHELWPLVTGSRLPEVVWEQVTLPRRLRARAAALHHGPDSFLPLRRPCPGVVTIHDLAFEAIPGEMPAATALKYRSLVGRGARSAQRVICPSQFTAADVSARYGVPSERVRVIPEAPALPFGTLDPPAGAYVVAVGDLRPKKNLGCVIDAFATLHAGGMPHRLVLAGADFGIGAELQRRAARAPVELRGFVDDDELDALLRGADALVVASLYEGFGLAVLDAMARGCPAVLARAGALPETGGRAAAYFDPHSAEDLAGVLGDLLADAGRRATLAQAGREWASRFSWERTAAATVGVYAELLE